MKLRTLVLLAGGVAAGAACAESTGPDLPPAAFSVGNGVTAIAAGGGHYLLSGVLDIKFSMGANAKANGSANGQFRQFVDLGGTVVDFHGRVTCLAVDAVNGRAWIGGVVTANRSTDPAFLTPINEVGRDVWFRVLDGGEGAGTTDRSTFLGFEGAADIITSEEYCAARIWPDNNDRTHPVTSGNIQVKAR